MNVSSQIRRWCRIVFGIGGLAFVYFAVYALNSRTGLYLDDFNYSHAIYDVEQRITSLKQIWVSMQLHYDAMNGRVVLHFLDQLLLMRGRALFDLINPLAFCALGLLIYYQGFGTLRHMRFHWLFTLYLMLYFFTPAFGQSFLWATGACNYLYGVVFILLYLVPWRRSLDREGEHHVYRQILWCVLMMAAGILVGWTNENLSMGLIALELGYLVADLVRRKKLQAWKISGLVGSVIGLICMMTAPGTVSRAALIGGYGSVADWIFRAKEITISFGQNFWPLLVILAVLLGAALYQCGQRRAGAWSVLWFPLLLLVGAGITLYAMSGSPTFPDRVWSGILTMCLVVLTGIYRYVNLEKKLLKWGSMAAFGLIGLVFCLHFPKTIVILDEIDLAYETRVDYIQEQIEMGNTDLIVPPIKSDCRFAVVYGSYELLGDPETWPNRIMAIYYGLDSLTAGADYGVPYDTGD